MISSGQIENMTRANPGFFPSKYQMLLLKVVFSNKNEALASWLEWRKNNTLEDMDDGSYRLIPLLYKKLSAFDLPHDTIIDNYKEIYLNFWNLNEKLIYKSKKICKQLTQNDIQPILLKGGPMLGKYYKDVALRPMGDIDILVEKNSFVQAINLLKIMEWKIALPGADNPENINLFHALDFIDNEGFHVDLHWEIIPKSRNNISHQMFFQSSQKYDFFGITVRTLCDTDQLFHICIHGARWNRIPSIRWISDACYIIRDEQSNIDWDRFVRLAKLNNVCLHAIDTLNLLHTQFYIKIPDKIFEELQKEKVGVITRLKYSLVSSPIPIFWDVINKMDSFISMVPNDGILNKIKTYIRYNKIIWGISEQENIVLIIAKLLLRRVWLDIFTKPFFTRKNKSVK